MSQMGFLDLSDRYVRLDARKDPLIETGGAFHGRHFARLLNRPGASQMRIA